MEMDTDVRVEKNETRFTETDYHLYDMFGGGSLRLSEDEAQFVYEQLGELLNG